MSAIKSRYALASFVPSAAFLALPVEAQDAWIAKWEEGNRRDLAHLRVATEAEHAADVAAESMDH